YSIAVRATTFLLAPFHQLDRLHFAKWFEELFDLARVTHNPFGEIRGEQSRLELSLRGATKEVFHHRGNLWLFLFDGVSRARSQGGIVNGSQMVRDLLGSRLNEIGKHDNRKPVVNVAGDVRAKALPRAAVFNQPVPSDLAQRPAEAVVRRLAVVQRYLCPDLIQ